MSRIRLTLLGTGLIGAVAVAGFAMNARSAPVDASTARRNLTLGTTLVGEATEVSELERGIIKPAAWNGRVARATPPAEPTVEVPAPLPEVALPPLPMPEISAPVLDAERIEVATVDEVAPAAPQPEARPLPVIAVSSGSMSLAPGQSVGVHTASSAGRGSDEGLPPGMAEAMRGRQGGGFSGSIGGGQCRPRRGGGTLVLR